VAFVRRRESRCWLLRKFERISLVQFEFQFRAIGRCERELARARQLFVAIGGIAFVGDFLFAGAFEY
jgi:hypothetical protein